jgi:hypothetical protein
MIRIVKVTGDSLSPVYLNGDYVVLITWRGLLFDFKEGDVITFQDDKLGTLIKVIDQIDSANRTLLVKGFHPLSTGSNQIGPVPKHSILGKVILHIKKPRQDRQA